MRIDLSCRIWSITLAAAAVSEKIDVVNAAGEHRNGTRRERPVMGSAVDASRHAGDHDKTGIAESRSQFGCEFSSQRRRVAGADNRDHLVRENLVVSEHCNHRRRRIECGEAERKIRLDRSDKTAAELCRRLEFALCVGHARPIGRGMAGSDHRDARLRQYICIAAYIEH